MKARRGKTEEGAGGGSEARKDPGSPENCPAAYHEARQRYEDLIASAPDALIFVNREGRIVIANSQAERMFGYKAAELVGRKLEMLIPPRFRGRHRGQFEEYFARPRPRAMGTREANIFGLRKDGSEFQTDISLSPLEGEGDVVVTAAIRDISEQKEAEQRIRLNFETQHVLSTILKISLEPVPLEEQLQRVLDLITTMPHLSFKPKGAIYLLDEGSDLLIMKAQRQFPEEHRRACGEIPLGKCLCGEAALHRVVKFTDEEEHRGQHQYVDVSPHGHYCVPIVSEGSTLGLINVFVREGTRRVDDEERFLVTVANTLAGVIERARAERALQESEEKYRGLVENLNVGVYRNTPGPEGRFLHVNNAVVRMFGYDSAEDLMGVPVASLYQDPAERARVAADVARWGYVKDRELRLRRKDGTPIWASFSARAQYDDAGEVKWFDGVIEDVTGRKWADREREDLRERLYQAEKLSALGRFTLDVAHQIRNPLTVVGGFARRLSKELESGGRGKEYADIIASEATRLEGILQKVLTLTESGKPDRKETDINAIARSVAEGFAGVCRAQDIRLETTWKELPTVAVDPPAVKEAVENLVSNAINAIGDGGVLSLMTGVESREGEDYVTLEVVDNGPGIPEANFGKIWEPFFTTKIESMGLGLGLAIAKKIVEDQGGFIVAHSQEGRGSMFTLYFPIRK